jgi:hypothetical protein
MSPSSPGTPPGRNFASLSFFFLCSFQLAYKISVCVSVIGIHYYQQWLLEGTVRLLWCYYLCLCLCFCVL